MQVIIKGRHTHVPNGIKEMAQQKLERVQRFFDRIQTMEIEFSEEHNPRIADKHLVEVTLTTRAHVLRAHASGPDPASAVDLVVDKLEAQVTRLKSKMVKRRTRGGAGSNSKGLPPGLEEIPSSRSRNGNELPIESEEEGAGAPRITQVTRLALKPMTAEEAVLQMESLGHDFYLFVDAESEQAGVVYRRRDGSFGLIEPS